MGLSGLEAIFGAAIAASLLITPVALAQTEGEMDILRMIYKDQDLVTPTRSPKPISQVAENITVISAEEIAAINAHTLTDVLYHVTGVQVDVNGGPGSFMSVLIQGSDPRHVRVLVDGVTINNLGDNVPDIGGLPVQQIERIEIIKGPASSSWGSSLGGVINVITKSPDPERKLGGTAYASMGERATGDFRADLSGTVGSFGYYLYGGGITSDGLTANNGTGKADFYGKLKWQASRQATAQFSIAYDKGFRGEGEVSVVPLSARDSVEYFFASPSFAYELGEAFDLDVNGRLSTKRFKHLFSGAIEEGLIANELTAGASAKASWHTEMNTLVVGADYDNGAIDSANISGGRQTQVRWALFGNDTLVLGPLTFTPGIRYDHTSSNGDFVSPSFGLTYTLFEKTILRGSIARGFNTPSLGATYGDGLNSLANPNLRPEKVWSYQAGVETALGKYLWLKATAFLHRITDVIVNEPISDFAFTSINSGQQHRQGVEAELKTMPVYHTSITAGFTFNDVKDRTTNQVVPGFPRYTYDVGVDYNDNDAWRGALRGHYIWWNSDAEASGKYTAMIWDLNLNRKIIENGDTAVELFFTAHNIFNGAQYSAGFFPNPRRWLEGGAKFSF